MTRAQRIFWGIMVALGCVAFLAGAANGTTWTVSGYVDGYATYQGDSYYWRGNDAYTRSLVTQPGYYQNGYYYAPQSYYQYSYHHTYKEAALPKYTDPDWRSKLLDLAAARDKAEAKIRQNAFEQQYFREAVEALGLQGNFRWNGYGQAPPYADSGYGQSTYSGGSTVYGYSVSKITDLYGDASLSVLYQQASRLAENAQRMGAQATTEFQGLVTQEGTNRARVAEILARGQAAQEALRAAEGSSARIVEKSSSVKVVPKGQVPFMPPVTDAMPPEWAPHAQEQCGSCHMGAEKKGGFDLSDFPTMSAEQRLSVVARLITSDPAKMMPRSTDGGPGHRLTAEQLRLWIK